MFNRLQYYLPSLQQCWVIVFFLIAVGGLGVGMLLQAAGMVLGFDVASLNPLLSYVLPLIPAFLYIYFSAPETGQTAGQAAWKAAGHATGQATGQAVPLQESNWGKVNPLVAYPLLAIATIAMGFVSEPLSSWLPMPEHIKAIFEKILSDSLWAFLATVIAAPVLEEFLLRGIIERGLLHWMSPWKAILWSAFFFAVIHLNPWQATGAFIAGILFGWIYWKTRSLVACIFVHMTNNGTAYLMQYIFPQLPPDSTYKDLFNTYAPGYYCIVFVIFAVLLAAILFYFNNNLGRKAAETE